MCGGFESARPGHSSLGPALRRTVHRICSGGWLSDLAKKKQDLYIEHRLTATKHDIKFE